jgi:hypothetical protein
MAGTANDAGGVRNDENGAEDKRVPHDTIEATDAQVTRDDEDVQVKVTGDGDLPYPVSHGLTSAGALSFRQPSRARVEAAPVVESLSIHSDDAGLYVNASMS